MRNVTLSILTLLISLDIMASGTDFAALRERLDGNSLPLVNITVDMDRVSKAEYTEGRIEIVEPQDNGGEPQDNAYLCKVKYRGSSSMAYEKKSLAIKLYDENWENLDVNIMGIRETNKWILDAMAIDRIRMRNRVLFDIWNEYSRTPYETDYEGRNGTEGQFVEVFVNGDYHGLYCLTDKIERKLLGLKKPKEQDDGSVRIRGVLYKCDAWSDASFLAGYDDEPMDGVEWNKWELQEPEDYPSAAAWTPLRDLIEFCNNSTKADFAANYKEHFYKDNLIDYALLILAFNISDNMLKNTFLSTVNIEDGQTFLITPWDLDASLGGTYNGGHATALPSLSLVFNWARPFYRLYQEDADNFMPGMRDRWLLLSGGLMSRESVNARIDDYARRFTLSGAWQREYERWNGNPVPLTENLQDETAYVKDYYSRNLDNITSLLNKATSIEAGKATATDGISIYDAGGRLLYRGSAQNFGSQTISGSPYKPAGKATDRRAAVRF